MFGNTGRPDWMEMQVVGHLEGGGPLGAWLGAGGIEAVARHRQGGRHGGPVVAQRGPAGAVHVDAGKLHWGAHAKSAAAAAKVHASMIEQLISGQQRTWPGAAPGVAAADEGAPAANCCVAGTACRVSASQ